MRFIWILVCGQFMLSCEKATILQEPPSDPLSEKEEVGDISINLSGDVVVGCSTDNSIVLSVVAPNGRSVSVNYGRSIDAMTLKEEKIVLENNIVEIKLEGLLPNSRYYYRIFVSGAPLGELYSFVTRRSVGSTFRFGVQGDSHPERIREMFSPELYEINMRNATKSQLDLYFTLGDDFSIERFIEMNSVTQQNVDNIYLAQRKYLGMVGCNSSLYLVNGNHEQAAKYLLDGTSVNPAVCAGISRKRFYPLPDPEGIYSGDLFPVDYVGFLKDYYAFEWGDALFVTIDPYWHSEIAVDNIAGSTDKTRDPWGSSIGDEQYQWLKNTLANSSAKYKFVFSHHVLGTGRGGVEQASLYEWGGYDNKGRWLFNEKRPTWEMPIHQLFVEYGVTIFFQGHDHLFCKQEKDGVIYQSCPNPADNTYRAFNVDAYTSGVSFPNSGFVEVEVSPTNVNVQYIRAYLPGDGVNGETGYSYVINSKR